MTERAQPLRPPEAAEALQKLASQAQLGETTTTRLSLMVTLLDEQGFSPLDRLLAGLFPGVDEDTAMERFRKWRSEVNRDLANKGIDFSIHIDNKRRSPRSARRCWLESRELVEDPVDRFARSTAGTLQPGAEVQSRLEVLGPVRYCWLYSQKNQRAAEELISEIETRFAASRHPGQFIRLSQGIAVSGELHPGDRENLEKADLVLVLVDNALLADAPWKGLRQGNLFPIVLEAISESLLNNLDGRQLFHHQEKPFTQCKGATKTDFCNALHETLVAYLEKHPPAPPADPLHHLAHQFIDRLPDGPVDPRARLERLDHRIVEQKPKESDDGVPAVDYLFDWAVDPEAPPFCALLGEYGIGKTTTCLMLTKTIVEKRRQNPDLPRVIYLDLREVGDLARARDPHLEEIIGAILKNSWKSVEPPPPVSRVLDEVRNQGALVIFDGLDEVLVHLDEQQGKRFTRELWRILPPELLRDPKQGARAGKALISCRTHYFRTLNEGRAHFRAEDRDGLREEDYRALVILPSTREQIRAYLQAALPERDPDEVIDMFEQVHNLSELAERPFTLSLITEQIDRLEQKRLAGEKVNGATLYQGVVERWLLRDSGKHQIEPRHKRLLMTQLAADLWRRGAQSLHIDQLEDWLMEYLESHPRVDRHYRRSLPALLKEDLRAATFLVHEGEDHFRFAHRSLHEFFLAGHLLDALLSEDSEWHQAWQLPPVSRETLGFLGQLLELEPEQRRRQALARLRQLHTQFIPQASELAFQYALAALERGHPRASLQGLQLPGARLRGLKLAGGDERLNLTQANLSGADLHEAELRRLDLTQADLTGARLDNAWLLDCRLENSIFDRASLVAIRFEGCRLGNAQWKEARWYRSRFIRCQDAPDESRDLVAGAIQRVDEVAVEPPHPKIDLTSLAGHSGGIRSCAWSPDGTRLLSAGDDGTLRLWDAASGELMHTLMRHQGSVRSCAWSPDGTRLLSAGDDGTLRLWDAAGGELLRTLKGHEGLVWSCAWSPDGSRLLSAGEDGTLRLWDTSSGELLHTLKGHVGPVFSCAWSPDSTRLLSAGIDGTLRLWDAASGELLRTLKGHQDWVRSCAWSPDGTRLLSAGNDGTLRLWDASNGELLRTLKGHEDLVLSCVWSPDGTRLLSAGSDGTLRLWDAADGNLLRTLKGHEDWVRSCAWSPDGTRLLSAGDDGTLRQWDAANSETLHTFKEHRGWVWSCAWSPDGTRLLSAGNDGTLRLWNAAGGELLRILKRHEGSVLSCAWSPDGTRLLSAGGDRTLRLWNAASGDLMRTLKGHEGVVWSCAWSPDGTRLLSAGAEATLRLWDAASGELLRILKGHRGSVLSCAWSPDGTRLLSASIDHTLRLWDAAGGELLRTLKGHEGWVLSCAWSPDGTRLLSGSRNGTLRLWDAASGELLRTLKEHEGSVWSCAWSPDGTRLLSAGADGTLRLWDAASGKLLRTLKGHEGWVMFCAWSPDGARLLSAGFDGTLRLRDAESGKLLKIWLAALPGDNYAAIDPGRNCLLAHGGNELWRHLAWRELPEGSNMPILHPLERFHADCGCQ